MTTHILRSKRTSSFAVCFCKTRFKNNISNFRGVRKIRVVQEQMCFFWLSVSLMCGYSVCRSANRFFYLCFSKDRNTLVRCSNAAPRVRIAVRIIPLLCHLAIVALHHLTTFHLSYFHHTAARRTLTARPPRPIVLFSIE